MYASGAEAIPGVRVPEDPWARAREAHERVQRQLRWRVPLLVHAVFDGLHPEEWLRMKGVSLEALGGTGAVTQVSNAGAWSGPVTLGGHRILALWSGASAIRGGPVVLGWLRSIQGQGSLSAIGNGAVLSKEELEQWLDVVEGELDQMRQR
jgi:hypothetical protein